MPWEIIAISPNKSEWCSEPYDDEQAADRAADVMRADFARVPEQNRPIIIVKQVEP